ncbi:efflux RND transporter permease subunit [Allorhizobium sp. BGMRC 0089]|uniref:efflux RND transporter permease subunit n=1 Tax=Allorhizobium sonneratiae TaxID=2934936 RepID=UPI002034059E|nr:efflux RND transporter permease subunit [Allorhizobium sonneratiae]MCM2291045.1 efflux RND transporter permease subunit [Allorhizobium sonneratiae]
MNFSAWSIRNPVAPLLVFCLLLLLGVQSFDKMSITRFPNIDVPVVSIRVTQSGASPSELQMQVTKEIEDAVASVNGVDEISSKVTDGLSLTSVIFHIEVPTEQAVQDVKDAIDRIRNDLPAGIDTPIVSKVDVEGQAIQTFAVSAPDMTLEELSWFVDDTIKRSLQGERGIGRIDRIGGAEREIHVELDPDRLNALNITAADVSKQLRGTNVDIGSGRGQVAKVEQAIRVLGDTRNVAALARTTIALPGGGFVRLGDLGRVIDTYEEPKSFALFNNRPVVSFSVFRAKGASEVTVADTVKKALDKVRADHPGVAIHLISDTVYFTYGNYEAAIHTLLEGAVLAVIVVFLFLRNWRATVISAIALPLSAIPTFWIMELLGFSLNLVSLLALTLATGILVDDAIVEIENIARHIKMGKTPYRAAIEAADEIGLAVIATTFTIIAVFVPVSFMPGIAGQYFIQFGLTVAFSVFFSLMVARLITPLMAAYLMRATDAHGDVHGDDHEKDGRIMRAYTALVSLSTGSGMARYATLGLAIVFLVGSMTLLFRVPGSFLPPSDAGRITLSVELPPNATLAETEMRSKQIYQVLKTVPDIASIFIQGGTSPAGDLEIRRAAVTLALTKIDHSLIRTLYNDGLGHLPLIGALLPKLADPGRTRPQWAIEQEVINRLAAIPDMRVQKMNDRGQRDVVFYFLSDNQADLSRAVGILEAKLRHVPVLANVSADGSLPRPELQIRPKTDEMARLGITAQQISDTIRIATIGDADALLPKISLDNRLIPIRVQDKLSVRRSLSELRALKIRSAEGVMVPLSSVAEIDYTQGISSIQRNNRNLVVSIGADLPQGVALDTATAAFKKAVAEAHLPKSVHLMESGDAKVQSEMKQSFINAMMLGVLMVLAVLILLFKDVIQPLTILFSLPLAIGGVAVGLILTGYALSMPVLIGILMLVGIVTKNAILLIDFAIEMRRHGMDRVEAMIEAGRKRARPIVMTSIAMSAGMLPSALGVGEGGSFRAPMAIAVIGGIIVSTVMSLVVVPAFFLIMDDLSQLLGRIFSGFVGSKEEEPPAMDRAALTLSQSRLQTTLHAQDQRLTALENSLSDGDVPKQRRYSGSS